MHHSIGISALVLTFLAAGVVVAADKSEKKPPLAYTMKSLTGKPVDLSQYKGKVVLIVNTASECGLTPQYEGLQSLHKKYKDKGLAILGFPCNQFGQQEPGTAEEISQFCKKNYGVEFDMFAKVDVNGDAQCDLYKYLTKESKFTGPIKWNFEKFLISKEGDVVQRFAPRTEPESDEVVSSIEAELAK